MIILLNFKAAAPAIEFSIEFLYKWSIEFELRNGMAPAIEFEFEFSIEFDFEFSIEFDFGNGVNILFKNIYSSYMKKVLENTCVFG